MQIINDAFDPRLPAGWRSLALVALIGGLLLAGCGDSDSHGKSPTATPTTALATISGSCSVPGNGPHGLGPCAAGTAIIVYRCDDRTRCLLGDGLAQVGSTTVAAGGGWTVRIAAADADETLVVHAAVAEGVVYRALALQADDAAALRAGLSADSITISPSSEATARLLATHGLANYSDSGAQQVADAVEQSTVNVSYVDITTAAAPDVATTTAAADPTVMATLASASNTPTPTAAPACCDCGGGCFADSGSGCGDCTSVPGAACVGNDGCVAFTPTATPTSTVTATATATATPTATSPPACCNCGGGCFQDSSGGCGDCAAVADAVCVDGGCAAFTATPTATGTATATGTPANTPTPTATAPPTTTHTASPTATHTRTSTGTPTRTITPTPTRTGTATATGTPTATITLTPTPTMAAACDPASCQATSDCACDTHTSLFAIAHAYNDPTDTVLYRVTVAAWTTGTNWGDGTNGFFYQATTGGNSPTTLAYVPFNGVSVSSAGAPALPEFSFIVPVDVSAGTGATTLTIAACASNTVGTMVANACDEEEYTPTCTATLWSETYTTLTAPAVGPPPASLDNAGLEFSGTSNVTVQNTGVYSAPLTLAPPAGLSSGDQSWLYNHLVFFDTSGNPYTNDIFDDCTHPSIGVLPLDEAAYTVPGQGSYLTKYGTTLAVSSATAPNRQFLFYTLDRQQSSSINVGAQFIYDASADCPGYINGGPGSIADTCDVFLIAATAGTDLPDIAPYAQVLPESTAASFSTSPSASAGAQEIRNVAITADSNGLCQYALNPLAVNDGAAYNPPDYVIDDSAGDWSAFPQALYYIAPAGFGTCSTAPFCESTASYIGYVPHYADADGNFGTLNGGSTTEAVIASFSLADEYVLGDTTSGDAYTLQWFDNCG
ncbi:MAG: hypothetical protein ACRERC_22985, partial [Candidatus Binatia bacterium]